MPQKVLKFTGINRKVNEFQNAGACEELINVRPSVYGLEVVKPKIKKFSDIKYDVYNHVFGDKSIFIGVSVGSTISISIINDNGAIDSIDSFESSGTEYDISFLANRILLYNGLTLRVYEYRDNEYVRVEVGIPDNFDVKCSVTPSSNIGRSVDILGDKNAITESWSACQGLTKNILGPTLVAFNFSLIDGTEYWTNKWMYVNPFEYAQDYDNGKHEVYYLSSSTDWKSSFKTFTVSINIPKQNFGSIDNRLVDKVNVYVSRPIYPYQSDYELMEDRVTALETQSIYAASLKSLKDMEVDNQLLYYYKSIEVSEIENNGVGFDIEITPTLSGEKVLEVDNGPVRRVGKAEVYNNRAHFYDAKAEIVPQKVFCMSVSEQGASLTADAYVYLDCDSQTVVLKTRAVLYKKSTEDFPSKIYCCYPDARATKLIIKTRGTATEFCVINLKQSNRYNFAYGEANYPSDVANFGAIYTTSRFLPEPNKISVSAPYNPFVFPVENSYSVGGKITDIATSYIPISSTQIGQYPLTVFTTNGIFSLEQGSGATLYGSVLPIQPLVASSKATPTPYGIFFVSSRNLYILTGREVANISDMLNGDIELTLREVSAYKKLCLNNSEPLFNFSDSLSSVNFEDFISNATLTYDELNNEVLISSNDESIRYSYVFNLNTKSYHKVSKRYVSHDKSARYVIEYTGSKRNVVDLYSELPDEQSILLQSRPFGLEMAYTHIERLMMFVDTKLSGNQNLCISVFGSDNLHDWKCIISSQKHNAVLRHIRTNRAAKSYKDYVILINGKVDTSTDLSDIIADYTVVTRRLA